MLSPVVTVSIFQKQPDPKAFSAGQVIFEEGQSGDEMYGILEGEVDILADTYSQSFARLVQQVNVTVLHGLSQQAATINNAIEYIQNYPDNQPRFAPAMKYEIDIRYKNGDIIHAMFKNKTEALKFLRTFV